MVAAMDSGSIDKAEDSTSLPLVLDPAAKRAKACRRLQDGDSTDSDSDSTNEPLVLCLLAKRATAPEGGSPAHKARRRLQDMHAMRHLRTSPKIADGKVIETAEVLEPSETLEQRLRFVSLPGNPNACNSGSHVSGLVKQMQNMCITQIQEVQQETVQPETAIDAAAATRLGGIAEKTQGRAGLWRICDKPESEKDIATTEEDGWQIVEEYGEKTPPRHSASPSPERDTASPQLLAPSKGNPTLSRADTVHHFHWVVANIPYPESTYSVKVDSKKQCIVIKTSNQKYYKRLDLPELTNGGCKLNDGLLVWRHSQDTLSVSYAKPTVSH